MDRRGFQKPYKMDTEVFETLNRGQVSYSKPLAVDKNGFDSESDRR